jgi:4-amino-4-deoxy-L-arabinose transferase-like glycosyltransferase
MTEREWREASDMQKSTASFAVIVLSAAALRFWSLGAGLPYSPGVDEPEIMERALSMMRSGNFNPRFYDYPAFYIYVQLAVACVRFLAGAMGGEWYTLADARPEQFYLWGRAVTATLGTATVALVYFIGLRWGTRYALVAASLMAVVPLHVRESHYVLTDVPVTFFVTLTFLLSLRAHEQARALPFLLAGVAAGLAAATKYTGAIALLLPLIAAWMTRGVRPSRLSGALAAIGGAAVAFLMAAPYTMLDLPGFLNGYAVLMKSYAGRHRPDAPAITYLKHLLNAFWWPGMLAILGGFVFACVRAVNGPGRVRWTLAVVFPLVFFWFISRQAMVFGRYLLPLVPFLCILAAVAVVAGVNLLRRFSIPRVARTALIIALTVGVLLPPGIQAIGFNRNHRAETVADAYQWILQNVPGDATVVIECRNLVPPDRSFKGTNVRQLRDRSYEEYIAQGVDYLVASSQCYGPYFESPQQFPREYAEYRALFSRVREVARFTPPRGKLWPEMIIFKVEK